jgi:creatinine amidohydrolase
MQWENLTAPGFATAVKQSQGVCVLPLPCIEKHGEHLPLGTDLFIGMEVARRAADIEPVIVFPPFYLTQILEAKHQLGTIAIGGHLMLHLLEAICDEIGRNGLKKIILFVSHGGNRHLASFFLQLMLETRKDYTVYLAQSLWDPGFRELRDELLETEFDHHAGEMETSMILAIHPELVRMDQIDERSGQRLGRLDHLAGLQPGQEAPIGWYANFPDHYAGDARPATAEKGERFLEYLALRLAEAIKAVKEDAASPALYKEFFQRTQH